MAEGSEEGGRPQGWEGKRADLDGEVDRFGPPKFCILLSARALGCFGGGLQGRLGVVLKEAGSVAVVPARIGAGSWVRAWFSRAPRRLTSE